MYRVLIVLLCIIFVNEINGVSLRQWISIDEDTIELTELIGKFWSLKPNTLKRTKPLIYCRMIDTCCDEEDRLEAISSMSDFIHGNGEIYFAEIMLTCLNSTVSNHPDSLCSSVVDSILSLRMASKYSDVKKYLDITSKYDKDIKNLINSILSTCNNEEIHSFFCLSQKKLMETCMNKVLQRIYNDNHVTYEDIIINTKQILFNLNQQLSQIFIKNINIE